MKFKYYRCLLLLIALPGIFFSCGQTKQAAPSPEIKDSLRIFNNQTRDTSDLTVVPASNKALKWYVVERGRCSNEKFTAYINAVFRLPEKLTEDSSAYRERVYLCVINKATNRKDSVELEDDPDNNCIVKDVSELIAGKAPLVHVSWTGDSDYQMDQFFGSRNDSLQLLFELDELDELIRANDSTLTGMVYGRDELVYHVEKYPVTVSLPDYTVNDEPPADQRIGYTTKVLSNFKGSQINGNTKSPYLLKAGTEILIDSIFRTSKMVRVMTKDSTVIYVPFSKIQGKIQVNAAG